MKKFNCVLESTSPSNIIDKSKVNDIDNLFLSFGLIYNDLKGIILFSDLIKDNYSKPEDGEISAHAGEYSGLQLQIIKLSVALIDEFLIVLEKNKSIIKDINFMLIEKGLSKELKNKWDNILSIALNPNSNSNSYLSKIARVRSNITYHYDHSGTQLRDSFIKRFFNSSINESNDRAYYSIGDTIETTRFFYCDAVIDEYINEHLRIESLNYIEKTNKMVKDMNMIVANLFKSYFKYKIYKK